MKRSEFIRILTKAIRGVKLSDELEKFLAADHGDAEATDAFRDYVRAMIDHHEAERYQDRAHLLGIDYDHTDEDEVIAARSLAYRRHLEAVSLEYETRQALYVARNCYQSECNPPPAGSKFYVSARERCGDPSRAVLLSGPFDTHREALLALPEAKRQACELDPMAHLTASWGTCAVMTSEPGILQRIAAGESFGRDKGSYRDRRTDSA